MSQFTHAMVSLLTLLFRYSRMIKGFFLLLMVLSTPILSAPVSFMEWKQKISLDLFERGISKQLLRVTIGQYELDNEVIALDRRQPEFSVSFGAYLKKRLTVKRVQKAKEALNKNKALLSKIETLYGIHREIIVALWSLETNLGTYMGNKPIIRSLMTLAYDGRRAKFFTQQLYYALKILQDNPNIVQNEFVGSWAGAMGHPQFMPETFIRYAVDGNGNDQIDLWHDLEDVFHSMGNFLNKLSWNRGQQWGQEVILPDQIDWSKIGLEWSLPVADWVRQGVEPVDGQLPSNRFQYKASIILPMGSDGPAFMVYDNFRIIMRWNYSVNYALTVGILADLIAQRYYLSNFPLQDWQQAYPNQATIKKIQMTLNRLGYPAGEADGVIGQNTRRALVQYQLDRHLTPDGYPNERTLERLNVE